MHEIFSYTTKDDSLMKGDDVSLGTIHLGLRVPPAQLDWFVPFQDFLCCDAYLTSIDPHYAAWHLRQSIGEQLTVVLDHGKEYIVDSFSESQIQFNLFKLAELTAASLIVGPYNYGEDDGVSLTDKTIKMSTEVEGVFDMIGVVGGQTVEQQVKSFRKYIDSKIEIIGFPHHINRFNLLRRLTDLHLLEGKETYSLLGFNSYDEIKFISGLGKWIWLLHTALPILASYNEVEITEEINPDFMSKFTSMPDLTNRQLHAATLNVIKFKALLPGDSDDEENEDGD